MHDRRVGNQEQSGMHSDRTIIKMVTKLIRRLKNIFERKLGLIFQNKETVIEPNGCTIEAYPSNHIDAYRALDNPKFILLDETDFFRKGE